MNSTKYIIAYKFDYLNRDDVHDLGDLGYVVDMITQAVIISLHLNAVFIVVNFFSPSTFICLL